MTAVRLPMPTVPGADPDVGNLRGTESFPRAAHHELANRQLRANLAHATGVIRAKRARVVGELDDWQELRTAASGIKTEAMADLPHLLTELEAKVAAAGGVVHWARDATEANATVLEIIRSKKAQKVVKVKSMATQEIALNESLEQAGVLSIETDLAELIVQLADDKPSHILVPAIHRSRAEIREIFLERMPDAPADLSDDPRELAMAARAHLREQFLTADVAISGANFAVAETGTIGVVESEGNGRMCLTLPKTLITVMGIEKVLPRTEDLEVFLQLLPRSSTGERMNPYTSMWTGVTPGDGPQEFHLVLLDNGRTRALADHLGRQALHCIRCSACLNVCPVYEKVGGHAYGSTYPGPIGAILTPLLTGTTGRDDPNFSLPFASSLCGACGDVCPVKIDIPGILIDSRRRLIEEHPDPASGLDLVMRGSALVMQSQARWTAATGLLRLGRILSPWRHRIRNLPWPGSLWTRFRDVRVPPRATFRAWWTRNVARTGSPPPLPGDQGERS